METNFIPEAWHTTKDSAQVTWYKQNLYFKNLIETTEPTYIRTNEAVTSGAFYLLAVPKDDRVLSTILYETS